MIRTDKLLGLMAEKHMTKKDMAEKLNITSKTFYLKMKKGVFGNDEIVKSKFVCKFIFQLH